MGTDGGITDTRGLLGLTIFPHKKRILNLAIGELSTFSHSTFDLGHVESLFSKLIINAPKYGPWAMENGIKAVVEARLAIHHSLDIPLHHGRREGHYESRIDASSFSKSK